MMKNQQLKVVFLLLVLVLTSGFTVLAQNNSVRLDPDTRYQTIAGFGAAIAWYENWVTAHPNCEGIYDTIFTELGLDILRLQNWYGKQSRFGADAKLIVEAGQKRMGDKLKILISSWAPPAGLKSNNNPEGGGTLKKQDGKYVYELFADYWYDSLQAYAALGIVPDYISIQNEPDFEADWNCNLLSAVETNKTAGYPQALNAVYNRLQEMDAPPRILGPEVIGLGYNTIQQYLKNMDLSKIDGIAYHLYHGGDHTDPDSFKLNMLNVASNNPDIPIFQTEFNRGTGFENAWLIHNSLVYGNVSAYLFWDLIWDKAGLVTVEFPWDSSRWRTEEGYYKTEHYYAVQHYSKYISAGYQRIAAVSSNNQMKGSAFISPDETSITAVILNTSHTEQLLTLKLEHYAINDIKAYLTQFGADSGYKFEQIGFPLDNESVVMPKQSAVTIVLAIGSER